MKELVQLYVLRYGSEDALTEIGAGFAAAAEEMSSWTDEGKKQFRDVATQIFRIRNAVK